MYNICTYIQQYTRITVLDNPSSPIFHFLSFSFLSTVVTAVLTYHLGWVYTILSPHDRQVVSFESIATHQAIYVCT